MVVGEPRQAPWKTASTNGRTPEASLYRMYEYFVSGYIIGLRSEIEFFFNQPSWAVVYIADPKDSDPEQYAILSCLPFYLVKAFNRFIERGLPRGAPALMTVADEEELKSRPIVLEEPAWVTNVPKLVKTLVIPYSRSGEELHEDARSAQFLEMNIIAEEPHVLFV